MTHPAFSLEFREPPQGPLPEPALITDELLEVNEAEARLLNRDSEYFAALCRQALENDSLRPKTGRSEKIGRAAEKVSRQYLREIKDQEPIGHAESRCIARTVGNVMSSWYRSCTHDEPVLFEALLTPDSSAAYEEAGDLVQELSETVITIMKSVPLRSAHESRILQYARENGPRYIADWMSGKGMQEWILARGLNPEDWSFFLEPAQLRHALAGFKSTEQYLTCLAEVLDGPMQHEQLSPLAADLNTTPAEVFTPRVIARVAFRRLTDRDAVHAFVENVKRGTAEFRLDIEVAILLASDHAKNLKAHAKLVSDNMSARPTGITKVDWAEIIVANPEASLEQLIVLAREQLPPRNT